MVVTLSRACGFLALGLAILSIVFVGYGLLTLAVILLAIAFVA